jgi:hypothetical protein
MQLVDTLIDLDTEYQSSGIDPFIAFPLLDLQRPSVDIPAIEKRIKEWATRCKTIEPMLYSLGEVLPSTIRSKWIINENLRELNVLKKVYHKALLLVHPDKQRDEEHRIIGENITRTLNYAYKMKQARPIELSCK